MKTVKILLLFVASLAILSSCKKDEPTIKFSPSATENTVVFADTSNVFPLQFDAIVEADGGIESFKIIETSYIGDVAQTPEERTAADYSGKNSYTYNFVENTKYTREYFAEVTKVEILFEVIDKKDQKASLKYTLNGPAAPDTYELVFVVKSDNQDTITDAIITINGEDKPAGAYTFAAEAGEYNYTVAKEGYKSVTGVVTVVDSDILETVILERLLGDWSNNDALALSIQVEWAQYPVGSDNIVGKYYSDVYGMAFTSTTATSVTITDKDKEDNSIGCDGWVLVDNIEGLDTQSALKAKFEEGNVIHTYDLPYEQHKAYELRYFISKMGTEYVLVQYVDGYRDDTATGGNVVVFKYKK